MMSERAGDLRCAALERSRRGCEMWSPKEEIRPYAETARIGTKPTGVNLNHPGTYKETTYQLISELGLLNGWVVDSSACLYTDNEEKPPTWPQEGGWGCGRGLLEGSGNTSLRVRLTRGHLGSGCHGLSCSPDWGLSTGTVCLSLVCAKLFPIQHNLSMLHWHDFRRSLS